MTVTAMTIFNNNNTRMMVFPFFDSIQITRIISLINQVIKDELCLSTIISTMYLFF